MRRRPSLRLAAIYRDNKVKFALFQGGFDCLRLWLTTARSNQQIY
jgi:hypothetical protein